MLETHSKTTQGMVTHMRPIQLGFVEVSEEPLLTVPRIIKNYSAGGTKSSHTILPSPEAANPYSSETGSGKQAP